MLPQSTQPTEADPHGRHSQVVTKAMVEVSAQALCEVSSGHFPELCAAYKDVVVKSAAKPLCCCKRPVGSDSATPKCDIGGTELEFPKDLPDSGLAQTPWGRERGPSPQWLWKGPAGHWAAVGAAGLRPESPGCCGLCLQEQFSP